MNAIDPSTRHIDRTVNVQAHVSGCLIVGGLLFGRSAFLLSRPSGGLWVWPSVLFVVAAVMAVGLALLPWLWPGLTVVAQRLASWVVLALGVIATTMAIPIVDLGAMVGCQAVLCGLLLAEVGGRRHALRWFWLSVLILAVAVVAYWLLVPLRLTAE
jgi:hypothetical protein